LKFVVIGAAGQLGQDLLREFGDDAIGLTHQDVDVTDGVKVLSTVQSLRPDWVLNTASFHRVDDCEANPSLALDVNALGALNVAKAADACDAGVVFFSTDYVFGGAPRSRGQPLLENDAPAPLNVYGATKVAGEHFVLQSARRQLVVRSAGLYGMATSRKGWTFPELMLQKGRADGAVSVVDDQVLSPTYTADLANSVRYMVQAGAQGLVHVTNSGECSWFELARETFSLAGLNVSMTPLTTEQSARRARRPSYSALASVRLDALGVEPPRPWQEALRAYLLAKRVI
jgi:dTDP-4-dehydrorhamnose reductase